MDARAPQAQAAAERRPLTPSRRRASAAGPLESPSSTAPRLALDAFIANLASTPRV